MKKFALLLLVVLVLSGCSKGADVGPSKSGSPAEAAQALLGDRLLAFSDSAGVVNIQFKARDVGSSGLIKNAILEDGRSLIRALYESPNFGHPKKVTLEALFEVKSKTGQLRDAVVGRMQYDLAEPVAWENVPRLGQFEQLLSVAEFPYN